ncbi:MAG: molecular chaperone [Sphingomonadales bacterium]|nr:molecular chaperone [Sphingomonadales bacterium]MBD3773611.1 molecular chaperone [Paracoccaceae bacterium]
MKFDAIPRFATLAAGVAALATAIAAQPAAAQGDLLVAPTRVILDGRRGTEVILSNIGSDEATYRIGLELRRMMPDGSLVDVDEADANVKERAALDMVRYAPRRILLPPGQPQAVRLAARPAADLPDGEYRVHMSFRAIPKPTPVTEAAQAQQGVSVRLIPVYGVTIPIIVRQGRISAQVAIANPKIVQSPKGPQLHLQLTRTGESSTYGEIRVMAQGSKEPIYQVRGLAIYPEVTDREVSLPLSAEQAAAMHGAMRIEYREVPEAGGGLIAALDTSIG